jgi:hypothetical protein
MERPGVQNSLDLSQRQQIACSQKCASTRPKTRHTFRCRRIAEIRTFTARGGPTPSARTWGFLPPPFQRRAFARAKTFTHSDITRLRLAAEGNCSIYSSWIVPLLLGDYKLEEPCRASAGTQLRLYGPLEPWSNESWQPGEIGPSGDLSGQGNVGAIVGSPL